VLARNLDWPGCFNVRDLGGLPVAGGRIRWGAVVRADSLQGLTEEGWAALSEHGVRTVIDLRNDDELGPDICARPDALETIQIPLDGDQQSDFWDDWMHGPQFATPLYYRPHIERFPERSASVLAAIATAPPGGVAFHCFGGRDRSGQIAMLLLALMEARPEVVADDYAVSAERLPARYAALGEPDPEAELEAFLAERGTTARELIIETVRGFDVRASLRDGGLTDDQIAALRGRLVA